MSLVNHKRLKKTQKKKKKKKKKRLRSQATTAIHWTPEGMWRRGRPKATWHKTVEKLKDLGHSWGTMGLAKDRMAWRKFVAALNADRHERQ